MAAVYSTGQNTLQLVVELGVFVLWELKLWDLEISHLHTVSIYKVNDPLAVITALHTWIWAVYPILCL